MSATAEDLSGQAAPGVQSVDVPTLCSVLDCNPQTIANYTHAGIILKSGRGEYPLWDSIRRVVRHLREGAANQGASAETAQIRADRLRYQTELQRIRLEQEAGRLVLAEDVERAWSELVLAARDELQGLPSRLKTELDSAHGIDADLDQIAATVDRSLRQLTGWRLEDVLPNPPNSPG